jgi:hypothetical protein
MTLEEGYIVRRCKQRDCRLLAMHPAKLWVTPTGALRVTLRCLKCREVFGGGVKPHEWKYLREGISSRKRSVEVSEH